MIRQMGIPTPTPTPRPNFKLSSGCCGEGVGVTVRDDEGVTADIDEEVVVALLVELEGGPRNRRRAGYGSYRRQRGSHGKVVGRAVALIVLLSKVLEQPQATRFKSKID